MEAVLTADVDILVPAARTWSIHAGNVKNIRAKAIVPAANAPYTAEAVGILHERGIISLPGFVTNSGGVYASSLYDSGVTKDSIEEISTQYYRPVVAALLRVSRDLGQSPVTVAEQVALRRLKAKMSGSGGDTRTDRLLKRLFRKGLIPRTIYGGRVASAFVENLRHLERQICGEGAC
jgi:glutamate dehydrogenase (NAD(P)+)